MGDTYRYINCCPTIKPYTKTIIQSHTQSQHILNITSCCKYVKPINEGIKYNSYNRVLMRRRGQ